ncbi:DUF3857 domain-containing protein [Flavobacteriaceae bacterium R38]|nr:DUF3857 domain-containing protein [Flavobacteriaceae bacterium R38]
MNKYLLTILSVITLTGFLDAQDNFKLGKVPKELAAETNHKLEKDTEAAIIYQKKRSYFSYKQNDGWTLITEVKQRIKIYNKDGFDWATTEIPLYVSGSNKEKVIFIKGITVNINEGKLVQTKLKKDGIFNEEINKNRRRTKITMPNVKAGSVLDLQYKIVSPFYTSLDEFSLQHSIPVDYAEVDVEIPEYFVFKTHSKGYYPIVFNQSKKKRTINLQFKERAGLDGSSRVKTTVSTEAVELMENTYSIIAKDVPSMKSEGYTNNINNYRTAIKFELTSTRFPGSPYKNYATSWETVAKNIYGFNSFGGELNKSSYFKKEVDELVSSTSDKLRRTALIFDYVKSKMNWNGYYGFTTDLGVKNAFKEQKGNVADINLMLTAMLRHVGVDANPVLVSTKGHGIPLVPTREGFNYVITAVKLEQGMILLDATDKYSYPNVLPERVLNWDGMLIKKNGSTQNINLLPSKKTKEIYMVSAKVSEDGTAEGKLRMQCSDQMALYFRQNLLRQDREQYLEDLENKFEGMEISEYKIANGKDISKPIVESYNFFKEDVTEEIGGKLYINPMLLFAQKENPFKAQKREYPVDFKYPNQKKFTIILEIPENYQVESLPENKALGLPDNLGTFKFNIVSKGNKIQLIVTQDINNSLIPAIYYESLKEYYNQVVAKESEKIILSKV